MQQTITELGQQAEFRKREIEELGVLPDDIAAALKRSGLLRLWVARAYGGQQSDLITLINAIETLAYYNGSTAWVAAVTGTGSLTSGYLKPKVAQTILGASDAMLGGFAAPVGKASKVDGGVVVNGRWGWGSGTTHCSTVVGGIMISDPSTDRPLPAIALLRPEDVTWHDTWHVNGLKGTGSGDYQVQDVFVPDGYWFYFPVQSAQVDAPLYRVSFYGALASGVAAVALGLAKRALDEIKGLAIVKKPVMAQRTLSEKAVVQYQFGEIEAKYESAKALLEKAAQLNFNRASEGIPNMATKSLLRTAATNATISAAEVVNWCYQIGGGSTIWDSVKLQELQRDVLVITQHGLVAPSNFEMTGRVALGSWNNPWLL